ncbi:hypothetical protein FAZ19_16195 [Sphingobacterium alkalisoli]|uniref:PcfK-like protein n=1 Tax=Sphingobacterium alkalisoli TaxID=1874115 RepID=A0A4U0GXE2_9SPHI|nr:PcfK-like family protein [Sphingobacterium alkalisoli]TJY63807.1 hypothetical protein FAZ19_16195 [Sphingobacterium alkalisoli]GGH24759.1 hypothetical protein GCM10011418_32890 [Sphingobacterium alkalisoli]
MKGTISFKNTIKAHLDEVAAKDPLFAENLKKEKKTIDGCVNYILDRVKKTGNNAFTDDEVFGMAIHYYDEDDIKEVTSAPAVEIKHSASIGEKPAKAVKPLKKEKVKSNVPSPQSSLFEL